MRSEIAVIAWLRRSRTAAFVTAHAATAMTTPAPRRYGQRDRRRLTSPAAVATPRTAFPTSTFGISISGSSTFGTSTFGSLTSGSLMSWRSMVGRWDSRDWVGSADSTDSVDVRRVLKSVGIVFLLLANIDGTARRRPADSACRRFPRNGISLRRKIIASRVATLVPEPKEDAMTTDRASDTTAAGAYADV